MFQQISAITLGKYALFFSILTDCKYSRSIKKKRNILINFVTNYLREMKLTLINMDYCLLPSDALNFF